MPDYQPFRDSTKDSDNFARLSEIVEEAVRKLGEPHRAVFALFAHGEVSYAQIAETLEIPVGTVMSRLHYARQALREALREKGYFEEEP